MNNFSTYHRGINFRQAWEYSINICAGPKQLHKNTAQWDFSEELDK